MWAVAEEYLGCSVRCPSCGESEAVAAPMAQNPQPLSVTRSEAAVPAGAPPASQLPASEVSAAHRRGVGADTAVPSRIGRFELRCKLGAGAFGTVYRAYDPQLEREVALKVPRAGTLDSRQRVERFLREAKAVGRLRHPHIVPVYDAGRDGELYYIASAFIPGRPLSETIPGRGMEPHMAAQLVRELAEAVAYAHAQGVVHRDIKPANVMIDERGEPHLMDFGLAARQDSTEKLTHDGAILGTPAYMAPEQAGGQRGEAQPASDQYSLGVLLYELLTGRTPFEGPPAILLIHAVNMQPQPPRSVKPGLPRDLETICLRALRKRPEDRYAGCQALADDLRRWLEGEPIQARRLGPAERLARWCRREPALAITSLACTPLGDRHRQSRRRTSYSRRRRLPRAFQPRRQHDADGRRRRQGAFVERRHGPAALSRSGARR
jgi:serine/threonine protein kinase